MHTHRETALALTLLVIVVSGCAEIPSKTAADQVFASPAVIRELHDTRPAFASIPPNEQSIVHVWLLANCAVGADDRTAQLTRLSTRVEPALIEAFRMGPPTALLAELAETRHTDFAAIKTGLDGEDREPFGPELRNRLAALSEDAYVNEGIESTITSYRIAALDGLARVGSKTTVVWLERTAPTLKDPDLTRAAERTRAALRERIRK